MLVKELYEALEYLPPEMEFDVFFQESSSQYVVSEPLYYIHTIDMDLVEAIEQLAETLRITRNSLNVHGAKLGGEMAKQRDYLNSLFEKD